MYNVMYMYVGPYMYAQHQPFSHTIEVLSQFSLKSCNTSYLLHGQSLCGYCLRVVTSREWLLFTSASLATSTS